MLSFTARRFVSTVCTRSTGNLLISLTRKPVLPVRTLALSTVNYNFSDMKKMMDEVSKNPKAMAFIQAIQKDPKIMQAVQDLMMTLTKKGYIDLKNPTKQPNLAMLADSEIRTKLFEIMRLLSAAGVFNTKVGGNPMDALSNIMGLLSSPSLKDKKSGSSDGTKESSLPKYDFTYDATSKDKGPEPVENNTKGWTDKLKKIFK